MCFLFILPQQFSTFFLISVNKACEQTMFTPEAGGSPKDITSSKTLQLQVDETLFALPCLLQQMVMEEKE